MQFLVSSSRHLGNAGVPFLLFCCGCFVLFLFGPAVSKALTIKIKIKIHHHHHQRRLEQIQERGGRVILGVSWRFPGVVVIGDLGWVKLRTDCHRRALIYAGRLRGIEGYRWPRIVGEALVYKRGMGSWVDYVRALRDSYGLGEEWDKEEWSGRN